MDDDKLAETARQVIDTNVYMVLGTADEQGNPWVSPVFYAADGYATFYWISSPEVTHSRNLAHRSEASVVIFDSRTPVGTAGTTAVYMAATVQQVPDAQVEQGLAVYPGPPERGARRIGVHEVLDGPFRLYRASVSQHWMLCPLAKAGPCPTHDSLTVDHRTEVHP